MAIRPIVRGCRLFVHEIPKKTATGKILAMVLKRHWSRLLLGTLMLVVQPVTVSRSGVGMLTSFELLRNPRSSPTWCAVPQECAQMVLLSERQEV